MKLQEKAILMSVSVHGTTGQKVDRKGTNSAHDAMGATDRAGRYVKKMYGDALREWGTLQSRISAWFRANTLPWAENGTRILPAHKLMDTQGALRRFNDEVLRVKESLGESFELVKGQAQIDLGDMFRDSDYPSKEDFLAKFSLETKLYPLPEIGDFRVQLSAGEERMIRASLQESLEQTMNAGIKELWSRLHERVAKLAEILNREGGKVRDDFLVRTRDLCGSLKDLNLYGDAGLDRLTRDLENKLAGITESSLESENQKIQLTRDVDTLMDSMAGFMGFAPAPVAAPAPKGWESVGTSCPPPPAPPAPVAPASQDASTYKCSVGPNGMSYSF